MAFTKIELAALKQRVSQAYHLGYNIANPSEYVERLGGGPAPVGVVPFSTAHVLYLIELCERGEPVAPVVEPVPVVEATPAAPEPVVEAAPVVEEPAAPVVAVDEKPKKSKKK